MFSLQHLEAHNLEVEAVDYRPEFCCHCRASKTFLKPRQLIRRFVRFIRGCLVHRSHVFVILWSCSACHRSFRHLPPFLKPHKRFVTPTIEEKSSAVLKYKRKPYRETVLNEPPNQTHIQYEGEEMDGSKLSHVTVWRWIQWMGVVMRTLLSTQPEMATEVPEDGFEYSKLQAKRPECMENLILARKLWMAQILNL